MLALLGGFVTLLTKSTSWSLRTYQGRTFRKSATKKLYTYTRAKQTKDNDNAIMPKLQKKSEVGNESHYVYMDTQEADQDEADKLDDVKLNQSHF